MLATVVTLSATASRSVLIPFNTQKHGISEPAARAIPVSERLLVAIGDSNAPIPLTVRAGCLIAGCVGPLESTPATPQTGTKRVFSISSLLSCSHRQ